MLDNPIVLIIIVVVLLWLASRFFGNRGPQKPTYDDKDIRSGGSIGGGPGQPSQRTHDDPNISSGGSIGGRAGTVTPRTHDDPNIRSGGSIGGSNVSANESRAPIGRGVERDDDLDERRNPFNSGSGRSVSSSTIDNLRDRAARERGDLDDAQDNLRNRAPRERVDLDDAQDSLGRRDDEDDSPPPRRRSGNDDPNVRSGGSFGD